MNAPPDYARPTSRMREELTVGSFGTPEPFAVRGRTALEASTIPEKGHHTCQ